MIEKQTKLPILHGEGTEESPYTPFAGAEILYAFTEAVDLSWERVMKERIFFRSSSGDFIIEHNPYAEENEPIFHALVINPEEKKVGTDLLRQTSTITSMYTFKIFQESLKKAATFFKG